MIKYYLYLSDHITFEIPKEIMDYSDSQCDSSDMSKYEISSKRQIIGLINAILEKRQLLNISSEHSTESAISAIISIEDNSIIIDCAKLTEFNLILIKSKTIRIETVLDHIKIIFLAQNKGHCLFQGSDAIRIDIPTQLTRLQRREFYRVPTPSINPATCQIAIEKDGRIEILKFPIKNISAGGIQITDELLDVDLTTEKIYEKCTLDLLDISPVISTLTVRNSYSYLKNNGHMGMRVGLQFSSLSMKDVNNIQKYISKTEHSLNKLK
jgi:c-di-GMP-binding flagellar brake protein YcgR